MRLIDADEVIKDLHGSLFYTNLIPFIEEQPTAYDVDKVVEQLEKKMNHSFNQRYKAFAESIVIVRNGGAIGATDIIRAGGKE